MGSERRHAAGRGGVSLDPIEKAIRNGLSKGDARDAAFREKVYRSAFAALDRALQSNPATTVENAIARRKELQGRIAQVEAGFLASPEPEPEPRDRMPFLSAGRDNGRFDGRTAPTVSIGSGRREAETQGGRPAGRGEPLVDDALGDAVSASDEAGRFEASREAMGDGFVAADPDERRRPRRRRPLAVLLTVLVLLAAAGAGGWWLLGRGLPLGAPDGTPPRTVQDELAGDEPGGGGPLGSTAENRTWISVFSPDDPSTVNVPEGGQAEVRTAEGIPFLRVRSGGGGAPVRFDVGQGVLEQLAGRTAVFDIVARAEDGADTQVSVECDFKGFGTCGRKRYAVTNAARADFLFDVEFPQSRPSGGGTITVDSDVTGRGKAVDVYEIRVSAGE